MKGAGALENEDDVCHVATVAAVKTHLSQKQKSTPFSNSCKGAVCRVILVIIVTPVHPVLRKLSSGRSV